MNHHQFVLHTLMLYDGVPMTEDEKYVSVILHHPGLAELELSRLKSQVFGLMDNWGVCQWVSFWSLLQVWALSLRFS